MPRKLKKYAAKLLFQHRRESAASKNIFVTCEEQIIIINGTYPRQALNRAKFVGKKAEHTYIDPIKKVKVYYEFIGVMDLQEMSPIFGKYNVYYTIKKYLKPNERKNKFIPNEDTLIQNI